MLQQFQPTAARSSPYRADIDGLRGIAVLSVVLFHASEQWCPGGFVGVDIFFVISGYLIAGILLAEMDAGRFTFRRFYERRIRRILPALTAMALATIIVGALTLPPATYQHFGTSLAAMGVYSSNVYFSRLPQSSGYFAVPTEAQPLLHTWSLGVEEQFYFLLPALLLFLTRFRRAILWLSLVALFALSYAFSVHTLKTHPIRAFYLIPARIWEFLAGTLMLALPRPTARWRPALEVASLAALAALGYAFAKYNGAMPFPGPNALLPCAASAALLYAGSGDGTWTARALGYWPLRSVGLISYSLYLWHWPVLVTMRYTLPWMTTPVKAILIALAVSVMLGVASYLWIERPFRSSRPLLAGNHLLVFGVFCSLICVAAGTAIHQTGGWKSRFSPQMQTVLAENIARENDALDTSGCIPERGVPPARGWPGLCDIAPKKHNVLFWGDSHVTQLVPLLVQMEKNAELGDLGIVVGAAPGCFMSSTIRVVDSAGACESFYSDLFRRASQPDIDIVEIQYLPWWTWGGALCVLKDGNCRELSRAETVNRMLEDTNETVRLLRNQGKRVIVGLPFPCYDFWIPRYENASLIEGRVISLPPPQQIPVDQLRARLTKIAHDNHAEVFDPLSAMCPLGKCILAESNVSIYKDSNHIVPESVHIIDNALKQAILHPTLTSVK